MRKRNSVRVAIKSAMAKERWKAVPDWEGVYEVSDHGNVRRILKSGKTRALKPYQGSKGKGRADAQYPRVWLARVVDGEPMRQRFRVHLLVWRAFRGDVPEGLQVNHRDLDRANASLSNLELLTQAANIQHAIEHRPPAIAPGVRARLRALAPKVSRAELARRFHLSAYHVGRAVADIPGPFTRSTVSPAATGRAA